MPSEEENIKEFDASICRNEEFRVASLNDGLPENLVVGKTSTESNEDCAENVLLCFDKVDDDEDELVVFSCTDLINSIDLCNETLTTVNERESFHEGTPARAIQSSRSAVKEVEVQAQEPAPNRVRSNFFTAVKIKPNALSRLLSPTGK